jgi:hypothetical protein
MNNILEELSGEEFTFKMQRLGTIIAIDQAGINIDPERFQIESIVGDAGQRMLRALITIATQEETIAEIPSNLWEYIKESFYKRNLLPKFVRRRFPVKTRWITAVHKFPELAVPGSILGREFVHLRILDADELKKRLEKQNI